MKKFIAMLLALAMVMAFAGCAAEEAPETTAAPETEAPVETACSTAPVTSQLNQWPVQIKLVPIRAPYFENPGFL